MVSLQNAKSGHIYKVTWMLGTYAGYLHDEWNMCVDDSLKVIANNGYSLIVRFRGRTIAMSSDVADSIKAEPI